MIYELVFIGDLHGRNIWQLLGGPKPNQIYVFMGDFTDSFTISDEEMITNLLMLIAFKKKFPHQTIFIWGNHDTQYLFYPKIEFNCDEALRPHIAHQLQAIYWEHRDLFTMAWQPNPEWLVTHAGISNEWLNEIGLTVNCEFEYELNMMLWRNDYRLCNKGPKRSKNITPGSPLWIDHDELEVDPLRGINQVVGHTPIPALQVYHHHTGTLYFTDVLGSEAGLTFEQKFLRLHLDVIY